MDFPPAGRGSDKAKALRLAPLTIETDRIRLGQLLGHCGHVRFDRLTAKRIEEVLGALKRSGLTNSTVNRYRSFISSVFTFAVKTSRIAANPVAKVGRFKENDSRLRWLKDAEEKRMRKAFVADQHEWEFDLALHTGMRRGEQFGLRWKNVDLERGMLTVKGKTGRRHIVANATAIDALKKLLKLSGDKEFVCPDANLRPTKRDWRRWLEECGQGSQRFRLPLARSPPHVRLAPGDARRGHSHGSGAPRPQVHRHDHALRAPVE